MEDIADLFTILAVFGGATAFLLRKLYSIEGRQEYLEEVTDGIHSHLLQLDQTHNPVDGCPLCEDK